MSTYEHVCGACGRPDTPRVWRSGDPEPGEDVRAVLDREGSLWERGGGVWLVGGMPFHWREVVDTDGPLVEVTLPDPVLS
jgi:hypothetical protein